MFGIMLSILLFDIVDLQIANSTCKTAKSEVHVHAYKMMIIPLNATSTDP